MIGIIGGSGVYEITQKADKCTKELVKTDYGDVEVSILDIFSKRWLSYLAMHQATAFRPTRSISEQTSMLSRMWVLQR